jgi:hypothetical protein
VKKKETLVKVQEIQCNRISKLQIRFGFNGFKDKKKEKQQHQPTSIEDFKLRRYTFKL